MTIRIPDLEAKRLEASPERIKKVEGEKLKRTGVEATSVYPKDGKAPYSGGVDIVYLDTPSLDRFLRSKGGRNDLAEDIVKKLLGHEPAARQD